MRGRDVRLTGCFTDDIYTAFGEEGVQWNVLTVM